MRIKADICIPARLWRRRDLLRLTGASAIAALSAGPARPSPHAELRRAGGWILRADDLRPTFGTPAFGRDRDTGPG
jgi:hypothetical protein